MNKSMKILLMDIETSPNLSAIWGRWEQDTVWVDKEWHMLSFSYKWFGDKKTYVHSLPEYKTYKTNKEDDTELVKDLWKLMDEATICIGHNINYFDCRRSNARFIALGLMPPSPYKTVDTLKVARRYFKFDSNKLNDLGEYLHIGKKVDTGGYKLWKGCMEGNKKSWSLMCKYNKVDVELLEKVYLKLRPWITNHPSISALLEEPDSCPKCGSKNMTKRGFQYSQVGMYQRTQCQTCGGWSRSRLMEKGERPEFISS